MIIEVEAEEHLNGASFTCSDEAMDAHRKDLERKIFTKSCSNTDFAKNC